MAPQKMAFDAKLEQQRAALEDVEVKRTPRTAAEFHAELCARSAVKRGGQGKITGGGAGSSVASPSAKVQARSRRIRSSSEAIYSRPIEARDRSVYLSVYLSRLLRCLR